MPKVLQSALLKLGITGCLALIAFNYPLLSLYQGHWEFWPALYLWLFGIWAVLVLIAYRIAEPSFLHPLKRKADRSVE